MFDRFRYIGLGIVNYKEDKATEDMVREFLDKGVSHVDIADCYMYLYRGDEMLIVWTENLWYAFCSEVFLVQNTEDYTVGSHGWEMLSYIPDEYGKCLFYGQHVRPSFKTLLRLKRIYMANKGGKIWK